MGLCVASLKLMEKTMIRFTLLLSVALLSGADRLAAQQNVEAQSITSMVKLEEVISGQLVQLNGKFKLRSRGRCKYLPAQAPAGPARRSDGARPKASTPYEGSNDFSHAFLP
jgi:hypothetical protein